eukprot:766448-Hanusia_phi.AAC.6
MGRDEADGGLAFEFVGENEKSWTTHRHIPWAAPTEKWREEGFDHHSELTKFEGALQDFLEFFVENRLEPEFCDASGPKEKVDRSAEYSDKIRQKIGFFGNKILERLIDSHVWREIFAPVLEQSPSMLHGDIWLGNIAVRCQSKQLN